MNTNSIPYWDTLIKWNDSLAGAPSGLLVFALCIAVGYVWKIIRVLPNRFIPLVVMLTGSVLHSLLTMVADQPAPVWVRSAVVGFIIGFLAWLFHHLLLKRLEDKFGAKLDEGDSNPTAFVKPQESKDSYDPKQP